VGGKERGYVTNPARSNIRITDSPPRPPTDPYNHPVRFGWLIPALFLTACGPTITADFDSPEPAARNAAIIKAVETHDASAVPDLVRMLDSDDPATRLLAINALERITGQTMGYDHAAPERDRREATERWQKWVEEHHPRPPRLSAAPLTYSPANLLTRSSSWGLGGAAA
jgi:HEAT repeats